MHSLIKEKNNSKLIYNIRKFFLKYAQYITLTGLILISIYFVYEVAATYTINTYPTSAVQSDSDSIEIVWGQESYKLNKENLKRELIVQNLDFPEIVMAQAILETGNFKSYLCISNNNLFGLRRRDGTYMSFIHWTESIAAYKRYIQKYRETPKNYYLYLDNLGYAEDPEYINKIKKIVNSN